MFLGVHDCLSDPRARRSEAHRQHLVGLVPGEGIGPALTDIARDVLRAVEARSAHSFDVEVCGPIGVDAVRAGGASLPAGAIDFFAGMIDRDGAVLCGPGGQRFVYDLRKRFDLFCKVSPIVVDEDLLGASRLRPGLVRGLDLAVVRENVGGIYQGEWHAGEDDGGRFAEHRFTYREADVRRITDFAARLAMRRSGRLCVVAKHGGVPTVTALWQAVAEDVARAHGVAMQLIDADLAAYRLMHEPRAFDVVLCPNMIGDILGDLLAVALGSRGLAYSGNFTPSGHAVYQTNHGAAFDLVDTDRANPVAHLYALAMMLAESFHLKEEAGWVRDAIRAVWRAGTKTADVADVVDLADATDEARSGRGSDVVTGTRDFAARVIAHIERSAGLVP